MDLFCFYYLETECIQFHTNPGKPRRQKLAITDKRGSSFGCSIEFGRKTIISSYPETSTSPPSS